VLETYQGLDLGMKYTSGKECFPCQVTLGDILHFIKKEKNRLGGQFNPENYVYFLPESAGPCRFGVYSTLQRIVFNSLPGLDKLEISSLTTEDGYSLSGMIADDRVVDFRKAAFLSVLITDILERLLWRVRPYEKKVGTADDYIEFALDAMISLFEKYSAAQEFDNIFNGLEALLKDGLTIIDSNVTRKPRIGIVGEIFLRMHRLANQNLIKRLEHHGAEVVNASFAEWVNYVSYEGMKRAKNRLTESVISGRLTTFTTCMKKLFNFGIDYYYQESRLKHFYRRARKIIDLAPDHRISGLDRRLQKEDTYSFEIGTETGLSIAAALEFAHHGFSGVVNVFPFTCMPGMTTSAILKPLMKDLNFPYLDVACDASTQPGREAAIRTFMYQAHQHNQLN
jgi:predicted nucleotide-binding protein (sugar kinase/HSP70/actin superfamily)